MNRIGRAFQTGRYLALQATEQDNPPQKGQRVREWKQLNNEVHLSLQAQRYETQHKDPRVRRLALDCISKHIRRRRTLVRFGLMWRKEPVVAAIRRQGPAILDELAGDVENEEKGLG